jgi:GT2 family glycosyltransferase
MTRSALTETGIRHPASFVPTDRLAQEPAAAPPDEANVGMAPVSIIVPVHGRRELTERCVDAVLADLPDGCEVIVVDDASRDSTPTLLASFGRAIRVLTLPDNLGYACACNEGAVIALHEWLLFLNNDTVPQPAWLQALGAYAHEHPHAAVIGAKLLYPTGAVQHAGVVIGQDGYPHNLYAGLPGGHPAVNRSRRLQAVTGACMLVKRRAFEQVKGFDPAYANSLEDVDLCLRIGEGGGQVHYCHEAVVTHLESASRGREDRFERSVARYRERWRDRARRDDLSIYADDGLLEVEYRDAYPQRLSISAQLAIVDEGREREIEALLEAYAAQVSGLLAEVMRLTAIAGSPAAPAAIPAPAAPGSLDHRAFLAEARRMEEQARELQQRVQEAQPAGETDGPRPAFTANRRLGYRRLADRVCAAVAEAVPRGSTVLVVSRGDRDLVRLEEREAHHFPQDPSGGYLGHHPRDSEEAIVQLEALRAAGAEYLVLPSIYYWWLEHYSGFAEHLSSRYRASDVGVGLLYRLSGAREPREREARE